MNSIMTFRDYITTIFGKIKINTYGKCKYLTEIICTNKKYCKPTTDEKISTNIDRKAKKIV